MCSIYTNIGNSLKLFRNLTALSQSDLAKILKVSFQQYQKYEKGLNKISISKLYLGHLYTLITKK